MDFQPFASPLLENAVNEFAKLPGIGRKTALRLVCISYVKTSRWPRVSVMPSFDCVGKYIIATYAIIFPIPKRVRSVPTLHATRRPSA